jgi:hypothetical protein
MPAAVEFPLSPSKKYRLSICHRRDKVRLCLSEKKEV